MKAFEPIQRLNIWRTLNDAQRVKVGGLAQGRQGVFFQYDQEYLTQFSNLSPFSLTFDANLQMAPPSPHRGLHGVFADSLPDGWGLLLMDRVFRQQSILPSQITSMDRLAFVGASAVGALSYEPCSDYAAHHHEEGLSIAELGLQAQAVFDGQTTEVLAALVAAGSSGGARPKALLYINPLNTQRCSTQAVQDTQAYLVKFTSSHLALGHEEGVCEAVYLTLAKQAGIDVPEWHLLPAPQSSGAEHWLALKRFDVIERDQGVEGRYHLHSACGLLDADFRSPSLDYQDLIKASSLLCKSPQAGQAMFKRAIFNLFALNQDDHSKNWAFLQNDAGGWQLAPFYDVTFSLSPYGEHATAYAGFGKKPPLKVIQHLADLANYGSWHDAKIVLEEVVEALSHFQCEAKTLGVKADTIRLIQKQLDLTYKDNKKLLV